MFVPTFRKLFAIALLLAPSFAAASHCTVSQIAVIAGSWENTSTKTSLTLQAQDGSGVSCHTAQTLRFSLTSSVSGSFTGQSGNALQLFISTNTANRNFYYDGHPVDNNYILTAKAGYGAADSWTELFSTTYNGGGSSDSSSSTATTSEETQSVAVSSSSDSGSSVHYNATSMSNKKPEMASSISAGRDRLGSVASPLEFRAETNFQYTKSSIFKWNFGDGSEGAGPVLSHAYEYPGEYVVVLNVSLPEGQAVSRVNVKVIEPNIVVTTATPERIEVRNNSKYEVSLFGRVLAVGDKSFAFPQDTIIKPGQSISFSSKITGLLPAAISDTLVFAVGVTENAKLSTEIEKRKKELVASIQNQIVSLERQIASKTEPVLAAQPQNEQRAAEEPVETQQVEVVESQTASVKEGWLQVLKRFFLGMR